MSNHLVFWQRAFKYSWSEAVFAQTITVRCKNITAELDKRKFGSGSRGKCVKYKNDWLTPSEFESACGLLGSSDWKRSIHCEGRKLRCLIEDGILIPHSKACLCCLCCNDGKSEHPVKYFNQSKRKAQDTATKTHKRQRVDDRDADTVPIQICHKNVSHCEINVEAPNSSAKNFPNSFIECLDGILLKIEDLKSTVKDLKDEFNTKLNESRQEMEKEKQKEIEAIQIKSKLVLEKRLAEEKQLMDIQLQEALARMRQEMTEKFRKSK